MLQWLHPTVVHFPIALLLAGLVFDVLGLVRANEKLLFAGFWCVVLGAIAAMVAVGSGLYAASHLGAHSSIGNALLSFHRLFAFVVLGAATTLAIWRIAMRGYVQPRIRTIYVSLSLMAAVLVITTGSLGGMLVYMYGLGLSPETARRVLEAQPLSEAPAIHPATVPSVPADAGASKDQ